jgi:hypothetical protein
MKRCNEKLAKKKNPEEENTFAEDKRKSDIEDVSFNVGNKDPRAGTGSGRPARNTRPSKLPIGKSK